MLIHFPLLSPIELVYVGVSIIFAIFIALSLLYIIWRVSRIEKLLIKKHIFTKEEVDKCPLSDYEEKQEVYDSSLPK